MITVFWDAILENLIFIVYERQEITSDFFFYAQYLSWLLIFPFSIRSKADAMSQSGGHPPPLTFEEYFAEQIRS